MLVVGIKNRERDSEGPAESGAKEATESRLLSSPVYRRERAACLLGRGFFPRAERRVLVLTVAILLQVPSPFLAKKTGAFSIVSYSRALSPHTT